MKKKVVNAPSTQKLHLDRLATELCGLFDYVENLQFWVKDCEGRYLWINRGFLMNYSLDRPEDLLGKTDYDLSPRHLADQYRLDDDRVLAGNPIINRTELVGRFDHTATWNLTNKIPLRDDRGRVWGTAGITCPVKGKSVEQSGPELALGKAVTYIREHFAESISNQDLAHIASLSVRAFERRFQDCFHDSPQQYVKRLRVRMTCHALVYTDQPLAQIATDHGFADQSHFTREFHRQMQQTPRQYREQYRRQQGKKP